MTDTHVIREYTVRVLDCDGSCATSGDRAPSTIEVLGYDLDVPTEMVEHMKAEGRFTEALFRPAFEARNA